MLPPKIQMPIKYILKDIKDSNLFQSFSVTSILSSLFPVLNSAICSMNVKKSLFQSLSKLEEVYVPTNSFNHF